MKAPLGVPAQAAGELYFRTDIAPEQLFVAIGRLRREARDEDDSGENEEGGDDEFSLCGIHAGEPPALHDLESDLSDDEPSLGSLMGIDQRTWASGGRSDREQDPAESGVGDEDGLHEQAGPHDGRGVMA